MAGSEQCSDADVDQPGSQLLTEGCIYHPLTAHHVTWAQCITVILLGTLSGCYVTFFHASRQVFGELDFGKFSTS